MKTISVSIQQLWPLAAAVWFSAGCARFHPQPLSPERAAAELENRSLTNAALKTFLETNLHREFTDWPAARWDFDMLTLAAFYYHPDIALAQAQWNVAKAGIKTAGGRPNPTVGLTPGYNTTTTIPTPWMPAMNFDLPIETAGKRRHRLDAAEHLSESARFNLAAVAWQVRSNLRASLLEFVATQRREALLRQQLSLQEQIVKLLEQQAEAGAIARSEAVLPRINLQKLRLDFADAQRQRADARVHAAEALGVSSAALDALNISADLLDAFAPAGELTSAEVRRAALLSRPDILGALADYAATEAALQTEIAKQYPDVHFNPGYQYDQGDNKWSLGITFELPILNQNQGPIAEAKARREAAAAKFNSVQAKALGEIERAVEAFRLSEQNAATLQSLAEAQAKQRDSAEAQFRAGAGDQLELASARFEFAGSQLVQLDGELKLRQAAAQLEDAVRRPLALLSAVEPRPTAQAKQEKP